MRHSLQVTAIALACCAAFGVALAGGDLHDAAADGDIEAIDRFIAAGEDVNRLKWKAYSPLYYAAKKGQLEAVRHLVEVHHATIDHGYSLTAYPLYIAATNGGREVVEYLVRQGADAQSVTHAGKGRKRQAYSARLIRPNWPWDRWIDERQAELDREDDVVKARRAEQRASAEAEAEAARKARLRARWERDAVLPVEVRRDKYLLALRKNLDEGDHESALIYCDFLRRLDVPLGPTFDLYHGQILLETGQKDDALDKLYEFVQAVDAADPNYTRALELINIAESR